MSDPQLSDSAAAAVTSPGELPLVTIGLPVYNGSATVKRALYSLIAQTYPNIEIIVSDNGSTDNTVAIVRRALRRHANWRVIEQPVNRGPHANFDAVLQAANSPYFMWAADDDVWRPDFVARMVRELEEHPDACVAMSAAKLFAESGEKIGAIQFNGADSPNGLSTWKRMRLLLGPKKFNLFIYGVFRTEVLRAGMKTFPAVLGGDRIFIAQFGLGHHLRYVDEVLYERLDRAAHRQAYKAQEKRGSVRFGQLLAFIRVFATTEVGSARAKLGLPYYAYLYARFAYRKQIEEAGKKFQGLRAGTAAALPPLGLAIIALALLLPLPLAGLVRGVCAGLAVATLGLWLGQRAIDRNAKLIRKDVGGLRRELIGKLAQLTVKASPDE